MSGFGQTTNAIYILFLIFFDTHKYILFLLFYVIPKRKSEMFHQNSELAKRFQFGDTDTYIIIIIITFTLF